MLARVRIGTLVGSLATPDRVAWATSPLEGPLLGGAGGTEPREMAVRMLILDPSLSREGVPAA